MHKIFWTATVMLVSVACGGGIPFGMVQFGQLDVEGSVDSDYLERQLAPLDPRFEACYVRALRKNRDTEGVLSIKLHGVGGTLTLEITENSTGSDDLAECVTENISALSIVQPPGAEPWDFTGEWSVTFAIARRDSKRRESQ